MSDILVYRIGKNLYLNLTNRCTNRCTFCVREQSARYEGYELWLTEGEPSAEALKRAFTRALEEMRGGGEEPEPAPMMGPNTTKPKTEETDPPAPPRRTRKKRGES